VLAKKVSTDPDARGLITFMNLFDLSGEVAVVIGGTGVLGGALAEGLAEAGAKVALLGRNEERGQARAKSIQSKGGQAAFFATDTVSRPALQVAHEKIIGSLGAPTVLVNAAGGNDPKVTVTAERPFEQIEVVDWQASFDLNVVGGFLLPCQEFGPAMAARGHGSIINIASVSAHVPLSRVAAYSAAKAAVLNLTAFLAREWAPRAGISEQRVNDYLTKDIDFALGQEELKGLYAFYKLAREVGVVKEVKRTAWLGG